MKITSLWDKLPQDIEFRIYGHVLAKRLSLSSHDKYMLMMLLDSQFCIHGHVLAKRLSSHRHDKHMLEMLASEGCILDPRTLFDALRRLAAHLGSPMDEPGEDEDFGCVSYEMPGEDEDCEWDQSGRHRLFRLDDCRRQRIRRAFEKALRRGRRRHGVRFRESLLVHLVPSRPPPPARHP